MQQASVALFHVLLLRLVLIDDYLLIECEFEKQIEGKGLNGEHIMKLVSTVALFKHLDISQCISI